MVGAGGAALLVDLGNRPLYPAPGYRPKGTADSRDIQPYPYKPRRVRQAQRGAPPQGGIHPVRLASLGTPYDC